jgi:hypothetical protein
MMTRREVDQNIPSAGGWQLGLTPQNGAVATSPDALSLSRDIGLQGSGDLIS